MCARHRPGAQTPRDRRHPGDLRRCRSGMIVTARRRRRPASPDARSETSRSSCRPGLSGVTRFFALLVLALLLASSYRSSSAPAGASTIRPRLSCQRRVESGHRDRSAGWCRSTARSSTSAIALLIGVPVSFGIALFLTELSPLWLKRPLGTAIELLAAIPSIIYGMWGLFVLRAALRATTCSRSLTRHPRARMPVIGALFQGPPNGIGMLDRGVHPGDHDHSVHRLGDARRVRSRAAGAEGIGVRPRLRRRGRSSGTSCCPTPRSASIGGIMLGLGRALGETMAVTFVIGNAYQINAVAVRRRQQHRLGARERVQRGGGTGAPRVADRSSVSCCSCITFIVLALLEAAAAQLARGEGRET